MSHPDLDRLTAWIHGALEPDEASAISDHVEACSTCRDSAEGVREEARILSREILSGERAEALKERILQAAGRRRAWFRGGLWQIPAAAALLVGLVAVLLSQGARHRLVRGRVALEGGSVATAPLDLDGSRPWRLNALESCQVRLSDRSSLELEPGTQVGLAPGGSRGVRPEVSSGEARFSVTRKIEPLTIQLPTGQVDTTYGRVSVKVVFQEEGGESMKNALAGAIVTVFAGSVSLSTPNGSGEAHAGQSAVLAPAEPPLLVASQDKQEELLRRLEQLAARVAKLETEVTQLEAKNQQLKAQVQLNVPGRAGGSVWTSFERDGVIINPGPGSPLPGTVRIEIEGKLEEIPEGKNSPGEK